MTKTKKYLNPPLVEAVFELFFESSNWSPAIPGIFFSKVQKKYPVISQSPGGFGVSFGQKGLRIGPGNNDLTQFKSHDGTSVIQLSNNLLTVNKLPEYSGWDSYKLMILEALDVFKEVLDVTKVNRIGLKSINKIEVHKHSYESFKEFFTVYPALPEGSNTNSIQLNYETPINPDNILAISLATLKKEKGYEAPTLFQLYFTKIKNAKLQEVDDWIEIAHENLYNAFDASLTEKCKNSFDDVK
jgi:uncharacterized protein (TIGR04255 family)